jgi:nitrite reductase (cytochrome c-552)
VYGATVFVTAVATILVVALLLNIDQRKREARQHYVQLAELTEETVNPAIWGLNFPSQYEGYLQTKDNKGRTKYGGSEAFDRLAQDPRLRRLFAGYPFSLEYTHNRGHHYMLEDQDRTRRVKEVKQPGACLHCHSSIIPAYRQAGAGDVMVGFQRVCAMPLPEARKLVDHPVTCIDCHDPQTLQLRASRPAFLNGIKALARSGVPQLHLPSIGRWRQRKSQEDYDVNKEASRQEMRSLVCGQCHVEYYFQGPGKLLTYPWHKGLEVEEIESYYNEAGFKDFAHAETKAPVLKAQHPEFEMWSQGIHATYGVSCADCHMPYRREGAVKISDHNVRSPLLNAARACQVCHHYPEAELRARVEEIQDRTRALLDRSEDALLQMMDAVKAAQAQGVGDEKLKEARERHRQAQWRLDFVAAENSMGFHAPQECARILGEAIDYARQGQISALSSMTKQEKP